MLDKNPDQNNCLDLISEKIFNLTYTSEPFSKQVFLEELTSKAQFPIIYLDFDLLYSGYVKSGIVSENPNVSLFQVYSENLVGVFTKTIQLVSKKQYLIILDSLNGFYNLFDEIDSGRVINSYLMLLATVAQQSDSKVICASIARKKEEGLVLTPSSRHIIKSKNMNTINLKKSESGIIVNLLNDDFSIRVSIRV